MKLHEPLDYHVTVGNKLSDTGSATYYIHVLRVAGSAGFQLASGSNLYYPPDVSGRLRKSVCARSMVSLIVSNQSVAIGNLGVLEYIRPKEKVGLLKRAEFYSLIGGLKEIENIMSAVTRYFKLNKTCSTVALKDTGF